MAISKERLEQLIEQEKTIYYIFAYKDPLDKGMICEQKLHKGDDVQILGDIFICGYGEGRKLVNLYETEAEAQWHADNDAERAEHFCPPMELKEYESYVFYPHNATANIWRVDNEYEVNIYKTSYKVDEKSSWTETFDTYPEAVAYARKLFKGEV